jgi:hypothetical protein
MYLAPGSQDLVQRDRPKLECIDADVMLPGHRLQLAMRVTVQVEGALAHIVPSAECIVAKDQPNVVYDEFGIALDALPLRASDRIRVVVVADDQVLPAVQASEQQLLERRRTPGEVPQVPDLVLVADNAVPSRHQSFVMGEKIPERASVDTQKIRGSSKWVSAVK